MKLFSIWLKEMRCILKDEGLVLFLIVLPLAYPILYSWIYNNEVVREVPVVVVDNSNTAASRDFTRMYDASPNVRVASYAASIDEAKAAIGRQEAYGILYFPADYSQRLNRMEQATVGIYCDMSMMLVYKNVYQTATAVSGITGARIQTKLLGNTTKRQDELSTEPIRVEDVPIFNTTTGYGNFVLPGVLILILQQTMLLAMGMTAGTSRERYGRLLPPDYSRYSIWQIIGGRFMTYAMIYAVLSAYVLLVIPKMFSFVSMVHAWDMAVFTFSYLLALTFFAMATMSFMKRREDVLMIVVFTSVVLLFISGVSWPASNMPRAWEIVGSMIPSTFAIKGFVAMNSTGARLSDITPQLAALWIQATVYFLLTVWIYTRETRRKTEK